MATTHDIDQRLEQLRSGLLRYRADRNPVEHATVQFHLGVTLLEAERIPQAVVALRIAAELFDREDRPVELAKATNMFGVGLRSDGDSAGAAEAFARAADLFGEHDLNLERGAALFNLGLVQRDRGDLDAAADRFRQAFERFREDGPPGQASAAGRELGATLLSAGELDAALEPLDTAIKSATEAHDAAAAGAAANVLGLVHLAADRGEDAVAAFLTAVGTNPRSLRAEAYAMAKANLALAYEQVDDHPRARLAARQARGTPAAPQPVVEQADAVLGRLGDGHDDLMIVLDQLPSDDRSREAREEFVRWADADPGERRAATGAWIDGQLARRGASLELAYTYLDVLLEMPNEDMEAVIRSTVEALQDRDTEDRQRFRSQISRAMARFHIPQWDRLKAIFNRIAQEVGDDGTWE